MKSFKISILALIILTTSFMSQSKTHIPDLTSPVIVVSKAKRTLELFDGNKLVKTYKMVLGFEPTGDKEVEGDGRTPEGEFYVFTKNAESKFHVSLGISYPAPEDAKRGLDKKLITPQQAEEIAKAIAEMRMPLQKTALGGEIYIHGGGTADDWTEGCVALKDAEIQALFDAVPVGTKVRILP